MRVILDARKLDDFGIGTYIRGLVGAASRVRPDWHFVLLAPDPDDELGNVDNVEIIPCPAGEYSPLDIIRLSAAARSLPGDVFHAPHYVTPVGLDLPLVVTVHDCIHLRYPEYLPQPPGLPAAASRLYARRLLRRAPRVAEHVIAVSEATRHDILDLLEAEPDSVTAIPNGVDAFWSAESPSTERTRSILWVGNPKPHKGLDLLLDAFGQLAAENNDLRLTLVGSEQLQSVAATHSLHARIDTPGHVSRTELRDLYRSAGVVCVPSRHEGFGLPALEAMATGAPVVATAVGGVPEAVGDGALLVTPELADHLAAGLGRVLSASGLARELGEKGRARAAELTWQRCAEATCDVYEAAAGTS